MNWSGGKGRGRKEERIRLREARHSLPPIPSQKTSISDHPHPNSHENPTPIPKDPKKSTGKVTDDSEYSGTTPCNAHNNSAPCSNKAQNNTTSLAKKPQSPHTLPSTDNNNSASLCNAQTNPAPTDNTKSIQSQLINPQDSLAPLSNALETTPISPPVSHTQHQTNPKESNSNNSGSTPVKSAKSVGRRVLKKRLGASRSTENMSTQPKQQKDRTFLIKNPFGVSLSDLRRDKNVSFPIGRRSSQNTVNNNIISEDSSCDLSTTSQAPEAAEVSINNTPKEPRKLALSGIKTTPKLTRRNTSSSSESLKADSCRLPGLGATTSHSCSSLHSHSSQEAPSCSTQNQPTPNSDEKGEGESNSVGENGIMVTSSTSSSNSPSDQCPLSRSASGSTQSSTSTQSSSTGTVKFQRPLQPITVPRVRRGTRKLSFRAVADLTKEDR
ncbi:hypothetical protein Pmani_037364 [Petrolisthes manimaculis]|uniref:Uncharacterized protein n=1 Tax=Petrolisthes manimaculis TaxID=1843537 RepID=A0AAE1TLI1_9EUCA|nr:hypothetical protein Pmani_037364 [Petrolisthes manimaculis]